MRISLTCWSSIESRSYHFTDLHLEGFLPCKIFSLLSDSVNIKCSTLTIHLLAEVNCKFSLGFIVFLQVSVPFSFITLVQKVIYAKEVYNVLDWEFYFQLYDCCSLAVAVTDSFKIKEWIKTILRSLLRYFWHITSCHKLFCFMYQNRTCTL